MIDASDRSPGDVVALRSSPGWLAVTERIAATIAQQQQLLERSGLAPDATEHARGFIAALRLVLRLPEQLQAELEAGN